MSRRKVKYFSLHFGDVKGMGDAGRLCGGGAKARRKPDISVQPATGSRFGLSGFGALCKQSVSIVDLCEVCSDTTFF